MVRIMFLLVVVLTLVSPSCVLMIVGGSESLQVALSTLQDAMRASEATNARDKSVSLPVSLAF
jgi:hypothetical protein